MWCSSGSWARGSRHSAATIAERLGREFLDLDKAIEERAGKSIPELFAERGEAGFRTIEEHAIRVALSSPDPGVLALGGGAVTSAETRNRLRDSFVVLCEVDVELAWRRVRGTGRPLAQDEGAASAGSTRSGSRCTARWPTRPPPTKTASRSPRPASTTSAAASTGWASSCRATGPVALLADSTVMGIYGPRAQEALGARLQTTHELPAGEGAKQIGVVEGLWSELRLDRAGTVVALGGGCTTDTGGFVAATYLRGVPWVAVPTTLVGQVDAAIGGKTGIDIPEGKNLVGAFHWPARVVLDETLLETLPEREWRQGRAELVKTQLLAGHELDVRGAAAFKAAVCLQDPHDHGPRRFLNLGHTFAHALEAAADFELPHGEAVALGLLAALRLSGRETADVERELAPQPVSVDPEARVGRRSCVTRSARGDAINVVVLGDDGPRVEERPAADVRRELERLIA